jgi:hypothetical protein
MEPDYTPRRRTAAQESSTRRGGVVAAGSPARVTDDDRSRSEDAAQADPVGDKEKSLTSTSGPKGAQGKGKRVRLAVGTSNLSSPANIQHKTIVFMHHLALAAWAFNKREGGRIPARG